MHWIHEYANEADDDDDDVPKPAQSLGTPVPRQKVRLAACDIKHIEVSFIANFLILTSPLNDEV